MAVGLVEGSATIAEWSAMPWPEGVRYELVEGRLVELADESGKNGNAAFRLGALLDAALPRQLWKMLLRTGVILASDPVGTIRIPDIRVVRRRVYDSDPEANQFPADAVLLVVEFVSDSSMRVDRVTKRCEYERAGVPHYWIFDVREKSHGPRAQILKLVDGRYEEQPALAEDGTIVIAEPVALSCTLDELVD